MLLNFVDFNPKETLARGTIAKKIAMEQLQPFTRKISGHENSEYNGGTKFRNNDTLLARITPCLENGKTAKVSILDENEVGFGSTEYIVLRAKQGISDPDFIYYLAISPTFRDIAIKSMVGTTGRQRVQQDVLAKADLQIPDLPTQRAIGKILSCLDDKIELNAQINQNLEAQAQALFQEMFIDNANSSWEIGTINDIGTVKGGSTPSKARPEYYTKRGIAWITPKDLSLGRSKFISHGEIDITELGLKNCSASVMPKGTVLFSSRAPIGYIAIASNAVTTNQGFKSIIPHPHIGTAFVYYFLKYNLSVIEGMASGSTFKEVSGSVMKSIPAQIPDHDTLSRFAGACEPIFEQQEQLEREICKLAELRDFLLPKLMSGEIDVSEVAV